MSTDQETVLSYDLAANEYAAEAAHMPDWVANEISAFAVDLGAGARVLEIGSGGGRDAPVLEALGISVRLTDVAQGFVELLRKKGFEAERLDPLTDNLEDPQRPGVPYDGIWACASLIHVAREDLYPVLCRLAAVTRRDGRLHVSVRDGDGESFSTHGSGSRRQCYAETYWREPALRDTVTSAGWIIAEVCRYEGRANDWWLSVRASKS